MTEQQTLYAVLDKDDVWEAGPFENANKADHIAGELARRFRLPFRVIAYTVIAMFGGADDR